MGQADAQLARLGEIARLFERDGVDWWLFGGWAVDFHAGRITREHDDLDLAIWASDRDRVDALLAAHRWRRAPEEGEDGYTAYERMDVKLELAFLACGEGGRISTPLRDGRRAEWPDGTFGGDVIELRGVRARVVSRHALREDKRTAKGDPRIDAKDAADVATLDALG